MILHASSEDCRSEDIHLLSGGSELPLHRLTVLAIALVIQQIAFDLFDVIDIEPSAWHFLIVSELLSMIIYELIFTFYSFLKNCLTLEIQVTLSRNS